MNIRNKNPRETATTISILTWWWTIDVLKKNYYKILGVEDLYEPLAADKAKVLGDRLEKKWEAAVIYAKKFKLNPSLAKTILLTFLPEYFKLACLQILNQLVLSFITPMLLGALLQYFKPESSVTYREALIYAGGMSLVTVIYAVTSNFYIFGSLYVGKKIRVAVSSIIYRKALRLSKTALGETPPGKIVNLVANDVTKFDLASKYLQYLWSTPLTALIVAYLLYHDAGKISLIGMLPIFIIHIIRAYMGKLTSRFRMKTVVKTDERVRLVDEIIRGLQVIKMYAWEKPFSALIQLYRRSELKEVKKSGYLRGIFVTFIIFDNRLSLYTTLVAMILTGENLTADKVFAWSSYFFVLSYTLTLFSLGITEMAQCLVAVERLQNFLSFDEFHSDHNKNNYLSIKSNFVISKDPEKDLLLEKPNNFHDNLDSSWAIKLENVTARWSLDSLKPILNDVSVQVEKGKLYVVIGTVGSGKSSLFSTILGEMTQIQGKLQIIGEISYSSQEAWVFGSSIRQNILFGLDYDKQRYWNVVQACALEKDFEQFSLGDQTIVGERGSSLSGGQKARINLARSIYRKADVYLMDDPLSAVDAHVGKHIFEECIQNYLANKTRILATHQIQYLRAADSIIVLDKGHVEQYNNYQDFLNAHPEYSILTIEHKPEEMSVDSCLNTKNQMSGTNLNDPDDENEEKNLNSMAGFIESNSHKVVSGNIAFKYFSLGSNVLATLILALMFLLTQFFISYNDFFVSELLAIEESRNSLQNFGYNATTNISLSDAPHGKEEISAYSHHIMIYSSVLACIFLIGVIRSFAFYNICMRCSQRLHDLAFGSLIHASMRFFGTNPSGRILNRFSKDLSAVDEMLPQSTLDTLQIGFCVLGIFLITSIVNPIYLIFIVLISIVFYWIRRVYLKTSKNMCRLEAMTCAPIFTHLNVTLDGISTIRACKAQNVLKKEFDMYQDIHTSSWFMLIAANSAFGFSLDSLCFLLTTLVTFSFLLLEKNFPGARVGLAITQVMSLTGLLQFGTRQSIEVANHLISVERVFEYAQLESEQKLQDKRITHRKNNNNNEEPAEEALLNPPENWPSDGSIEFRNVYMRYFDDGPYVLQGLTMAIQSGEKIGIVGRTGAGKSSLVSALFRLAEVEGAIEIDGVDTVKVSLENLRSHISIIPQDPVLFAGTLRRNLDPFQEYPDSLLWSVLEKVELKEAVRATENGLDHRVLDKGSNFSVGQRQLICLARAILRNNRILVLDEATANVDPQTDCLIQSTIRTQFSDCTVLTVAHRLNTIMDSDKILVMNEGRIKEFDHPYMLLSNENGLLTSLTKEAGSAMYKELYKIAQNSYDTKNSRKKIKF